MHACQLAKAGPCGCFVSVLTSCSRDAFDYCDDDDAGAAGAAASGAAAADVLVCTDQIFHPPVQSLCSNTRGIHSHELRREFRNLR